MPSPPTPSFEGNEPLSAAMPSFEGSVRTERDGERVDPMDLDWPIEQMRYTANALTHALAGIEEMLKAFKEEGRTVEPGTREKLRQLRPSFEKATQLGALVRELHSIGIELDQQKSGLTPEQYRDRSRTDARRWLDYLG